MTKLAYILSLERSGSTALSFLLADYAGVVSLGEIERTLRSMARPVGIPNRVCSCGAEVEGCPVWGPVYARRDELSRLPLPERYRLLFQSVEGHAGDDALIVDSSKSLDVLSAILDSRSDDLRVLFLVKDVRNYLNSVQRRAGEIPGERMLPARYQNSMTGRLWRLVPIALRYAHRWWRHNRAMQRFLGDRGVANLRVGYDELCLDHGRVMPLIESFLELTVAGAGREPPAHHVLFASKPYLKKQSGQAFEYDARWLWSERLSPFDIAVVTPLMKMNREFVYGNQRAESKLAMGSRR